MIIGATLLQDEVCGTSVQPLLTYSALDRDNYIWGFEYSLSLLRHRHYLILSNVTVWSCTMVLLLSAILPFTNFFLIGNVFNTFCFT